MIRAAMVAAVFAALISSLPLGATEGGRQLPYPEVVARPRFAVHAHAPASLFNLVDRAASFRRAGDELDPRYLAFWRTALGFTAEDESHFQRYRDLRRRFRGGIPPGGLVERQEGLGLPFPIQVESVRFEDKLALLFLTAADWDEVARGARLLLGATDEEELLTLFQYFRGRFAWVERRALYLSAYRARARAWFDTARPEAFFARLAEFFHVPAAHVERFHVGLAWLPAGAGETRAFVVEDAAVIEVPDGIGLRSVMDVAVHELAHRLHERTPLATRRVIEWSFFDAPAAADDAGLAAATANLWWESVATAVGQGVFARLYFPFHFDEHRNWYEDPSYDALAKAIAPLLARYLEERRPLDADFIHETVAAYAKQRPRHMPPERGAAKPADLARRSVLLTCGPAAQGLLKEAKAAVRAETQVRLLLSYAPARFEEAARAVAAFPGLPVFVLAVGDLGPECERALRLAGYRGEEAAPTEISVGRRPGAGPFVVVRGVDETALLTRWRTYLATP
jgi:hypothetical protein